MNLGGFYQRITSDCDMDRLFGKRSIKDMV